MNSLCMEEKQVIYRSSEKSPAAILACAKCASKGQYPKRESRNTRLDYKELDTKQTGLSANSICQLTVLRLSLKIR